MAKKRKDDEERFKGLTQAQITHLKVLEKVDAELKNQQNILEGTKSIVNSITSVFNLEIDNFSAKLKRSQEQTNLLKQQIEDSSIDLSNNINDSFSQVAAKLYKKNGVLTKDITKGLKDLSKIDIDIASALTESLKSGDFSKFWETYGDRGMETFQKLVQDKKGFHVFKDFVTKDAVTGWKLQQQEIDGMNYRLQRSEETIFSIEKSLATIGEYFGRDFMPKSIIPRLYDFDQILNDTQKEFGLAMDRNKAKFSELIGQTQIFGMGAKESAEFMGKLGENLRTTNFQVLSVAAKDMAAIGQSTGLSTDELSQLGTQMMFYGRSSMQVAKFTEQTMQMAQRYGLNAKKVLQEFTKALPTMRSLGWQGGEKALRDMVIQAQKLGQNLDDLASSAKKLRTLEGSIEASADLALVGISTNAIQMLGAARRGGQEFSSFVANLTQGIGQIKKDGSVDFDPVDIDRLNVISESIGIPLEKLQDQVALTAQRNAKINLFPSSMFKNLRPEEQEFLLNAANIGNNGKIELNASILGTKDLGKVSASLIEGAMSQKKSLENQAKENTSFQDSVKNLKQSVYNIFTHLQPIIEGLTKFVVGINTWINSFSETGKKWIAGFIAAGAIFFSVAKHYMSGYWMGIGFNSAVNKGGFLSGFGKLLNKFNPTTWFKKAETVSTSIPGGGIGGAGSAGRGIGTFADSLKAMPSPAQLLSLAAAIAALGVAFVGIGFGIKLAASGLAELTQSFNGISNAGYALTAVVAVMGGFIGMLGLMIPLVGALGVAETAGAIGLLALGVAFLGIGFGIKLAADGLSNLVSSFDGLKDSSAAMWSVIAVMGSFVGIAAMLIPVLGGLGASLVTFGALGMVAVPPLLALGTAAIAVGYGIKLAGEGISYVVKAFSEFTSSILKTVNTTPQLLMMSGALLTLAPALVAFGTAGLVSGPGIVVLAISLGILNPALSSIVPSLDRLSKLNTSALLNVGKTLSGLSLGLIALSGAGLLFPALALAALAIGIVSPALSGLADSVSKISKVDFKLLENVSSHLKNITPSLLTFSTIGLLSPLLIGAGVSLGILGKSLIYFSGLNLNNLSNVIQGVSDSVGSLIKFSTIGLFSAGITLASFALGTLGKSLTYFSNVDINNAIPSIKSISDLTGALIKFAGIGIFAAPILLSATVMTALGVAIPKFVNSLSTLTNIKTDGIDNLNMSVNKLIPSLMSLSFIGIVSLPIIAGATMLAGAGALLEKAGNGFMNFVNLDWTSFKNIKNNVGDLIISLLKLSTLSIVSVPILTGAGMLASAGGMLLVASKGFNVFSGIDFNGLLGFTKIIPDFVLGISKLSIINLIAVPVLAGSTMLALAGISLLGAAKGFMALTKIDYSKLSGLSQGIDLLFSNIIKFSAIGMASPLLLTAGMALGAIGFGLDTLSKSGSSKLKGISEIISELVPSLTKLSLIGLLSAPLLLASSALGVLGSAFTFLSKGVAQMSGIDWNILTKASEGLVAVTPALLKFSLFGVLSAPIAMGASALALMGKSMLSASAGFSAISNINWTEVNKLKDSIDILLPGLVNFGIRGLLAAPGISLMSSTINSLANTMQKLANPLDVANESIGSMADNISKLKSSIQGLDTSKLNTLASTSERFVNSSSSVSTNNQQVAEAKPIKVMFDDIKIRLNLNGKDIQEIIVKDTAYHS